MAAMNCRGQILILFTLVITVILASVSVLHAQNLLAGFESSRALMIFPKDEIRNLKIVAEKEIMQFCGKTIDEFYNKANIVSKQIKILYSQKGVYADVIVYQAVSDEFGRVECYHVRIVYVSGDVKYYDHLYCCKGGSCV
ncbi:MAG: hypothetical protein NZ895_06475 [Archaeoglobaceae archaeon]|nr:hypothetical protein [Archaeoglobaceae archaeon]MCX8152300.1 hypothetical protein [Archaeoglobaceae archaeon]MDW8013978.1 hypothetical protein [Archaeoglobaceae archaeon]